MRDLINLLEAANPAILDDLEAQGYQLKVKGNQVAVLVQVPEKNKNEARRQVMADILAQLEQERPDLGAHTTASQYSSIGVIAFDEDPTVILVKDQGIQGDQSAGVANELALAQIMQSMIEKYKTINVTFQDERGKKLSLKNVNEVDVTGRSAKDTQTGEVRKADVVLKSKGDRLPVSIKEIEAESWESADRAFGARAREIIDDLVDQGILELEPVEPTEEEAMKAIFGSDLDPKGGIVVQTFKPEHFRQDGNNITVDAYAVIKTKQDIPDSHLMVWLLRNQKGRLSKSLGIRGIRVMGSTLTRALGRRFDKDVILVDKDGNLVERPQRQQSQTDQPQQPRLARPSARRGGLASGPEDENIGRSRRR